MGHLEQARKAFDSAVDVLLQSPYGARSEPRIREHFDRLVERISAYEVSALAQGDGFVEKKYAPASIDDLLTLSTFDRPAATSARKRALHSRQSTSGSLKPARWPEASQTFGCMRMEQSMPTMSSRACTMSRHQAFLTLRLSSTPTGP
jgi:hypothetical protein